METLRHGLPAVPFNWLTGPADLIEDGLNGYLVPPEIGIIGLGQRL
jgi:hypothetical protein